MNKVLDVIYGDRNNGQYCYKCHYKIKMTDCELAYYSGKGKGRKLEGFLPTKLLHCDKCDLYYVTGEDCISFRELTKGYNVLVRDYVTYVAIQEKNKAKRKGKKNGKGNPTKQRKIKDYENLSKYIIGKEIFHNSENNSYGRGVITELDRGVVVVKFDKFPDERRMGIRSDTIGLYSFNDEIVENFLKSLAKVNDGREDCFVKSVTECNIDNLPIYNIAENGKLHPIIIHPTTRSFCAFKWHPEKERDGKVEMRNMIVKSLHLNMDVHIAAEYCFDCDEYKIDEPGLKHYEDKYGRLILLKKDINGMFIGNLSSIAMGWDAQTPLAQLGYTVREGFYTSEERQILLSYIIDNKLLELSKVMYYIKQAIGMGEMNYRNNVRANEKRKADLDFLEEKYLFKQPARLGELKQK